MNDREKDFKIFENYFKSFLSLNGVNLSKLIKSLEINKGIKYNENDYPRKFKQGTIRIFEIKDLLNELGADLCIIDDAGKVYKPVNINYGSIP